jgi:hypothetical protein
MSAVWFKGSRVWQKTLITALLFLLLLVILIRSLIPSDSPNAQLKCVLSKIGPTRGLNSDQEFSRWRTNADILNGLGPSVTPLIIQTLRGKDSPLKNWCVAVLNRVPLLRIQSISAEDRATWLQWTLEPRKPTSQALVSNLVQMLAMSDVQGRNLPQWSANHLAAIGEAAVPPLIHAVSSSDSKLRIAAIQTLSEFECSGWSDKLMRHFMIGYHGPAQIRPETGEKIIQVLSEALRDSDSAVRLEATNSLKRFQENNSLHRFAER